MERAFTEERPIFQQLAQALENAILSGAYAEESQIPSITEYSVAYRINPATAMKGINVLVDAGLIYKKRGIGMFVASGARDKLLALRRDAFYEERALPVARDARTLEIGISELQDMMKRGYDHGD